MSNARRRINFQSCYAQETKRRPLLLAAVALAAVSILFAAAPELDIRFSRLFWNPMQGFALANSSTLLFLRDANRQLPWLVIGAALILLVLPQLFNFTRTVAAPHKLLFILLFFAIGPGLLVHMMKILVGRPRPRDIEAFGGMAAFKPPWEISQECFSNCSFISGEASSAFALLTLAVFIPATNRRFYLCLVGVIAAAFSLNRVAFGAHFLSDVILAWNVMWIVAIVMWRWASTNAAYIDAIFWRDEA